jgi:C4-dicarboxylate-specific signal transduction histidine kinase
VQQVNLNIGLRESISGGLKGARLAREVQQHSAELEHAYQTLRENQQQLMLAEKMASLGRLTAGIAHEMNTPLAAVRAVMTQLSQLIEEYEASIGDASVTDEDHHEIVRELRSAVQLADKAAERAAGFVRGVKSQTRGLATQEHQAINAVIAVEDTLLLLNHVLMQGKCPVDFQKSDSDIRLFGVPGRLEQVVTNLINNAVDASYPDGGPITVCLNRKSDFVELQISDSGGGILPENLSKIFDPMFSTKPFGSSTGLGLTIVHDIVVGEFGGSIDVSSVAAQGATFTIRFPLYPASKI